MIYKLSFLKDRLLLYRVITSSKGSLNELEVGSKEIPFLFDLNLIFKNGYFNEMVDLLNELLHPFLANISEIYLDLPKKFTECIQIPLSNKERLAYPDYVNWELSQYLTSDYLDYFYNFSYDSSKNEVLFVIMRKEVTRYIDKVFRMINGSFKSRYIGISNDFLKGSGAKNIRNFFLEINKKIAIPYQFEQDLTDNVIESSQNSRLSFLLTILLIVVILGGGYFLYDNGDNKQFEEIKAVQKDSPKGISRESESRENSPKQESKEDLIVNNAEIDKDEIQDSLIVASEQDSDPISSVVKEEEDSDPIQETKSSKISEDDLIFDLLSSDFDYFAFSANKIEFSSDKELIEEISQDYKLQVGGADNNILSKSLQASFIFLKESDFHNYCQRVGLEKYQDLYYYGTKSQINDFFKELRENEVFINNFIITNRNSICYLKVYFAKD